MNGILIINHYFQNILTRPQLSESLNIIFIALYREVIYLLCEIFRYRKHKRNWNYVRYIESSLFCENKLSNMSANKELKV